MKRQKGNMTHTISTEAELRQQYPDHVICGITLPYHDIDQGDLANDWYIVALANRRRHGKYQIIDYVHV